jgi:hypothetical protein
MGYIEMLSYRSNAPTARPKGFRWQPTLFGKPPMSIMQ